MATTAWMFDSGSRAMESKTFWSVSMIWLSMPTHLLLGQLAHGVRDRRPVADRDLVGDAVAVVRKARRRGQDRENQQVYEDQTAHERGQSSTAVGAIDGKPRYKEARKVVKRRRLVLRTKKQVQSIRNRPSD
jgi:hypothetical protein